MRLNEIICSDKKYAIHCKKLVHAQELIDELNKIGISWGSGETLNGNTKYHKYGERTCYVISSFGLLHGPTSDAISEGYNIIEYTNIDKSLEGDYC